MNPIICWAKQHWGTTSSKYSTIRSKMTKNNLVLWQQNLILALMPTGNAIFEKTRKFAKENTKKSSVLLKLTKDAKSRFVEVICYALYQTYHWLRFESLKYASNKVFQMINQTKIIRLSLFVLIYLFIWLRIKLLKACDLRWPIIARRNDRMP